MKKNQINSNTKLVKKIAKELGFSSCGISKARFLKEEEKKFQEWLKKGYNGTMKYLEKNFDKRLDPTKLVKGSKSVISLSYNYYPQKKIVQKNNFILSKYAYGKDYHIVIKQKLKKFLFKLNEKIGNINARLFVDSAPVHERAWAKLSGIGWIGKNSLLLNKHSGSFFFLAEIISDLELKNDYPVTDHCGTCTACIDACPTDAITEAQVIDANRCISYLTIESKKNIPEKYKSKMNNWIFGCDICQDVCPWNKFSKPHSEKEFFPNNNITIMKKNDWKEITLENFNHIFKNSAVKRTKYEGIKRNIEAAS